MEELMVIYFSLPHLQILIRCGSLRVKGKDTSSARYWTTGFKELWICLCFEFQEQLSGKILRSGEKKKHKPNTNKNKKSVVPVGFYNVKS